MPSSISDVAPADSSLHGSELVIDGVLVVNDAWAVGKSHYVVALFVPYYFSDVAIFEDETCPETATGTGRLLGL